MEILKLGLEKHIDDLTACSVQAGKEFALEKALVKMQLEWQAVDLAFVSYKDTGKWPEAGKLFTCYHKKA